MNNSRKQACQTQLQCDCVPLCVCVCVFVCVDFPSPTNNSLMPAGCKRAQFNSIMTLSTVR